MLRRFVSDQRGIAALEFAVGAPVMITLLLGGVDSSRYALATRRIDRVAANIGQMVSVNTTATMTAADLQFYEDGAMVVFPLVLQDASQLGTTWQTDMPITVSSVKFAVTNGKTVATVAWSVGPKKRACNSPLTSVPDTSAPSPTTLAQDAFGTGTIIVVDVGFTFRPTIATRMLPSVAITRSFYVQPRYVPAIAFGGTAGSTVNQC
ncbi:MAG: TadE/TadG family type IV pilus assembly protein [Janthinobacterium lividum]